MTEYSHDSILSVFQSNRTRICHLPHIGRRHGTATTNPWFDLCAICSALKFDTLLRAYIRKTIYFAYAKLYVLYKVYTFAYAKTYTCAKHIVLHMRTYMFCITYEKLYILNKKRRAFHEEAPTTKITTDTAFVLFCFVFFFLRITTLTYYF